MRRSTRGFLAAGLAAAAIALSGLAAFADDPTQKMLPVPAVTIPPGEAFRDDMLTERAFAPNFPGIGGVVDAKQFLLGRVARRTLLPGQPIPLNAVEEPRTVTRGVPVRVIVEDGGLVIIAYGAPLQSGGVGALIRVRNLDTGVIVMGVVQPDGTVRVSNG